MRVVIDIQSLQTMSKKRGIGNYTVSLLQRIALDWNDYEVILLVNNFRKRELEDLCFEYQDLFDNFKVVSYQGMKDSIELIDDNIQRILMSEELRNCFIECLNPDFVLITSLFEGASEPFACSIPKERGYKVGVIGYDLIPFISPEVHLKRIEIKNWYYRKLLQLENSDMIFSISKSSKSEFHDYLGCENDKVVNISSSCSPDYEIDIDKKEQEKCLSDLGISSNFILYSGTCDKRKNLFRLIEAYSLLDRNLINTTKLVLVGNYSKSDRKLLLGISNKFGLPKNSIVFTGYISNHILNVLYCNCKLFIFPSLHEGFGLPVLEAMHCGAPVICSNTSSLPEVVGLKEAMFDPYSAEQIRNLINKGLTDKHFIKRLKTNSIERRHLFSWEKTVEVLKNNIEKICDSSKKTKKNIEPLSYMVNSLSKKCKELTVFEDDKLKEIACCINYNAKNVI